MSMKSGIIVFTLLAGVGSSVAQSAKDVQTPPRHFLVLLSLGPQYETSVSIREQKGLPAHSAYMSELERQGKLVLGGPLVASFESMRPTGAVMVLRAETEEEVRALLAADPSGLLSIQEVRPFVLSGGTALKP
jgi:uncharacterized protein YciI